MKKFYFIYFIAMLLFAFSAKSQTVFINPQNSDIYDFIDELANDGYIDINSTIKPFSGKQIYNWLTQANTFQSLNKRQKDNIAFYLKEYNFYANVSENPYGSSKYNLIKKWSKSAALQLDQLGFFYKDSLFSISAKPIWGVRYEKNASGSVRHFWGGASAKVSIGKHWGIWADLRDNSQTELLSQPNYFTQQEGGNYKIGEGGRPGGDYSEMRGGMSFTWNWGDIALMKDHIQWGDNYHGSNILSGRTPSYAMIKLHLKPAKWFEFNYHHGWLVSEVTDSSSSYFTSDGYYRNVFRPKFIAANMFTFIPWRGIQLSFGNSIIYSDLGGPHPAYLVPFLFYKSIDHTLNHNVENQNSQLYLNLSIRKIKHLHLYGSMFIDEFSKTRIGVDTLNNFFSYKGGFKLSNFPFKNISLTTEYTITYPMTYQHRVQTTTFASNQYNLGHYMRDNSSEIYFSLNASPFKQLTLKAEYIYAKHGDDISYINNSSSGFRPDAIPVLKNITWESETVGLQARYQLLNDVYLSAYYRYSEVLAHAQNGKTADYYLKKFGPEFNWGYKSTFGIGFNMGL